MLLYHIPVQSPILCRKPKNSGCLRRRPCRGYLFGSTSYCRKQAESTV